MSTYYETYCKGFNYERDGYNYTKNDVLNICKILNIKKIRKNQKKEKILKIIDSNIYDKIETLSKELPLKINYARIIFKFIYNIKYKPLKTINYNNINIDYNSNNLNSSIKNMYNWGKIYKYPSERFKHLFPQFVNEKNEWKNICIICKKENKINIDYSDEIQVSYYIPRCLDCKYIYSKKVSTFRTKAYQLFRSKGEEINCEITGCSKRQLKYYFETLFNANMNWDNQTVFWEIDHRIPVCWFDFNNDEELKNACNYKNLQPMKKEENMDKSGKYPKNNLFSYAFHSSVTD